MEGIVEDCFRFFFAQEICMKKIIIVLALMTLSFPAFAGGFSGSVGAVSDYVLRGRTQSDGSPAIQYTVKAEKGGFYVKSWGSQVDFNNDTSAEDRFLEIYNRVIDGEDFDDVAVEFSKGQQALSGGRLGWLKGEQLPDVFVRVASELKNGELSLPFETSSGFHLIKLNAVKGNEPILEEQIKVRHILIKTNEVLDDSAAEEKLKTIRQQIIDEGNFGAVAAAVSEDSGSAQDGGDMGWATRNFFVPEFEEIAYSLEENEISQPFRSRYGWHIIEYLGKRIFDNTEEIQKRKAISSIRNSKLSSEIEIWASELRDEAFVEKLPYN